MFVAALYTSTAALDDTDRSRCAMFTAVARPERDADLIAEVELGLV
jgi:hypothetical protein